MDSCPDIKAETPVKSTTDSEIQFGCINTKTGEVKIGYVENGEMKYRRDPWWKRWFTDYRNNIYETKFVSVAESNSGVLMAIYTRTNIFTGKIVSVFGYCHRYGSTYFHVQAYIQYGDLVQI